MKYYNKRFVFNYNNLIYNVLCCQICAITIASTPLMLFRRHYNDTHNRISEEIQIFGIITPCLDFLFFCSTRWNNIKLLKIFILSKTYDLTTSSFSRLTFRSFFRRDSGLSRVLGSMTKLFSKNIARSTDLLFLKSLVGSNTCIRHERAILVSHFCNLIIIKLFQLKLAQIELLLEFIYD